MSAKLNDCVLMSHVLCMCVCVYVRVCCSCCMYLCMFIGLRKCAPPPSAWKESSEPSATTSSQEELCYSGIMDVTTWLS